MPYVPVPKDLNTVKTKVAFNLTKRQLICFSLAAAVGVPAYFLTRGGWEQRAPFWFYWRVPCPFSSLPSMRRTGSRLRKF